MTGQLGTERRSASAIWAAAIARAAALHRDSRSQALQHLPHARVAPLRLATLDA